MFDLLLLFLSVFCRIDPGCIHITVSQNICQSHDVLILFIIRLGKKMAEIVGIHLFCLDFCLLRSPLHHFPDVASVQRLSVFCHKDTPIGNPLLSAVAAKHLAQFSGYQNHSDFSLRSQLCPATVQTFHCNRLQFTDPNPCCAYGLEQ